MTELDRQAGTTKLLNGILHHERGVGESDPHGIQVIVEIPCIAHRVKILAHHVIVFGAEAPDRISVAV